MHNVYNVISVEILAGYSFSIMHFLVNKSYKTVKFSKTEN